MQISRYVDQQGKASQCEALPCLWKSYRKGIKLSNSRPSETWLSARQSETLVLHLECAFRQVIAVNYHPINAKYWTATANSTEAEGSIAPYRDATFTALETPMALTAMVQQMPLREALLTAEDVAQRLNVTKDWVWDHSSRKAPYLPVIRMSDGVLRYRWSEVEEFVNERERLSSLRRRRR